jgi:hypothetical protein
MTVFRIRFSKFSFFFRAVIIVAVVDDSLDYLFSPCRIQYPCALAIELYILSIYISIHGFGSHVSHSQSILLIPTAFFNVRYGSQYTAGPVPALHLCHWESRFWVQEPTSKARLGPS